MREIMQAAIELDARAAHAIAAAMRELAKVDGEHAHELALIDAFEADLPPAVASSLADVNTPEAREALLKSLVLLAFADGPMTPGERAHIQAVAAQLGLTDADVSRATVDVASVMLSGFSGVTVFREQVHALGRDLGLDEDTIKKVLA